MFALYAIVAFVVSALLSPLLAAFMTKIIDDFTKKNPQSKVTKYLSLLIIVSFFLLILAFLFPETFRRQPNGRQAEVTQSICSQFTGNDFDLCDYCLATNDSDECFIRSLNSITDSSICELINNEETKNNCLEKINSRMQNN